MNRIMKYLGLDNMDIVVNLKTKMCKLVLYKDGNPVMSGAFLSVHDALDTEIVFKDFIDDWFIDSKRGMLLMNMVRECSENYLISENYNSLEMKLTLAGY